MCIRSTLRLNQYWVIILSERTAHDGLTCRSGFLLTGQPGAPAVWTPPPRSVPLSLLPSSLGPLQPSLQGLHLLPAPRHLLQKAVLHQPGDLIHGSFEDRLHDPGELRLKRYYSIGHCASSVLTVFFFSVNWREGNFWLALNVEALGQS